MPDLLRDLKAWIVILTLPLLVSCTFDSPKETVSYGKPPPTFKADIRNAVKNQNILDLYDPYSAKLRFLTRPKKAYFNEGLIYGGDVKAVGHAAKVAVNAKNRLGGYVGENIFYFFISKNNRIYYTGPYSTLISFADE
jgi:hypothetical protein